MIKVQNKKVIARLSKNSLKANRLRNSIAVIAIALTTLLFTSLFTMGSGLIENIQRGTMRQAGGDGHAVLKYITDEQYNKVKDHPLIKEIAYCRALCDGVENDALIKRRAEFWYYDKVGLKLGFIKLDGGHLPEKENEIMADSKTLMLLQVPEREGAEVKLKLNIRGKVEERTFVLSGWWESDPVFNVGQIFASKAYVAAHEEELTNTYYKDYSLTGTISAYMMFANSMNLQSKLDQVLVDSGFSPKEGDAHYIASNVNWSYLSTNFKANPETIIALVGGSLIIILAGYLIIYNIFQISVVRDTRFYGLLKTIGTTSKQLRKIIHKQAFLLSLMGIPIGLVLGFVCGKCLVPVLMSNTAYAGMNYVVSINPKIFIGAAVFAFVTVWISTLKPGRMAGKISPIEAVNYTDNSLKGYKKKERKSRKGARMPQMAAANLGRNKKRTVLVIISLSLSLILLDIVVTLSGSMDMDKFFSKFNDTDFMAVHADYFNNDFYGKENEVSESYINAIMALPSFKEGGRIYGGRENMFFVTDPNNKQDFNCDEKGDYITALFGMEDLPFEHLKLLDGEMDKEKLLSGKYILEGIHLDDNDKPYWEKKHYEIGDKVQLHYYEQAEAGECAEEKDYEMTVIGHVAVGTYTNSDGIAWDYIFYLPAQTYSSMVPEPAVMSYSFNVEEGKMAETEAFMKDYTENVEPIMNYTSKTTTKASFDGMRQTLLMIGMSLGGIIGLIGLVNFINAVLTSIFARLKEFAMLESIGMTKQQLRKMLCYEGLYYAGLTGFAALFAGIFISLTVVNSLCNVVWFLSYHLTLWPFLVALPILVVAGYLVPFIAYKLVAAKATIVERLRENF